VNKSSSESFLDSDSDSDSGIDMSKLKNIGAFFSDKKKMAFLATFLLILIPVILTFYIRLQPQYLPATDAWASNSVQSYFKNQIANNINAQYPNLPSQNKQELIEQQYADFYSKNKESVEQQIKSTSEYFKTGFRYQENGETYTFLGDLDSYFFLRQARNIEEKGTICDEIRNGECYDNHMYAPIGTLTNPTMHPYGIFYLYKFLRMFNPQINLMQTAFLLPTLLAAIAAVAAFFVGRKLMNEVAGFFAAMLVTLSPMFLSRTLGSDTDIWNVFFPLIILWLFLEAFEAKSLSKKMIMSGLVALFLGLFSFAWTGWWYIFHLINAALIGYIFFILIKNLLNKKSGHDKHNKFFFDEIKQTALVLLIIVLGSALFVSLFSSSQGFVLSFSEPMNRFIGFKQAANPDLWPNVITTVAEMNEASIESIINQTSFGIKLFFSIALFGIITLLLRKKMNMKDYILLSAYAIVFIYLISQSAFQLSLFVYLAILLVPIILSVVLLLFDKENDIDIKPALILSLWFVGSILAGIKGVRFIVLLAPAFAVAFSVAIGKLHSLITNSLKKEFKLGDIILNATIFIVLAFLIFMPFSERMPYQIGLNTAKNFVPSMTLGWWDTLGKINNESKPDAIINSWWDFGHWFKYRADRAVTLDGASQVHPNAHWLGRLLQTDNEKESIAILRMLDCGSNNAFEEVNKKYSDTELSHNLVKQIIMEDEKEASLMLKEKEFNDEEIKKILSFTHCNPPENYLITSEDMVGKAGVWAHFGLWDIDRAYVINNVRSKGYDEAISDMMKRWNYTSEESSSLYYSVQALQTDREMNDWISPWPNYMTGDWVGCTEAIPNASDPNQPKELVNHLIICGIGRTINEDSLTRTSIDAAVLNMDNNKESHLVIGSYDKTGYRRGSGKIIPSGFVIMKNDSLQRIKMENSTFPYDVIIDVEGKRALISDPLLSESMFTKLFFMDGKYTSNFEKFSDVTDITGQRIIVWKVKWGEIQ
jgi:dolichyl-diphosphooligosaccharide--protein glycosyltransferase